eukprot:TRINITY_DN1770_c0_g1_i4.p1 TRINITY_DN1770_c0_g1~~TRINITY_DN1770_c0_g1_i4.p1  ORF type:complete len:252 (+),score=68.27 TRINITY_DN1770_c0_g1_i4:45-800(+)
MNKSLDDLIKEKKSSRGRGGGRGAGRGRGGSKGASGGRQAGGGSAAPVRSGNKSSPYSVSGGRGRGRGGSKSAVIQRQVVTPKPKTAQKNKVFVTNLPFDWEETDVLHVMETVGEVDKLTIFWDPQGRPTGSALVVYKNNVHANSAVEELSGARLGNNDIVVTHARGTVAKQNNNQPQQQQQQRGGKGGKGRQQQNQQQNNKGKGRQFGRKGGKKGGKKGRKGNASNAKVVRKEVKAEDLDKQLAAFVNED